MGQPHFVLSANDPHIRRLERRQLRCGRPLPQPHVQIDANSLVTGRILGVLQPDAKGKIVGIGRRAVLPLPIRAFGCFEGFLCTGHRIALLAVFAPENHTYPKQEKHRSLDP